jgi:hypothetical protein
VLGGVVGDAVAHQTDGALVVDLAEGPQELTVVEVAFVERLNQAVGPGFRAELGAVDGYREDPLRVVAEDGAVVLVAVDFEPVAEVEVGADAGMVAFLTISRTWIRLSVQSLVW